MDETVRTPEPLTEDELTDYDEAGVDLTLIRWWMSLSALEKLRFLDRHIASITAIRERNARR